MNIYPAVDILGGKAVRLKQGRKDDVTVYGQPLEMAQRWASLGAEWLHVVDLDGAFNGEPRNHAVIAEIVSLLPGLKVQVGGGIRNKSSLDALLQTGVRRVILGTSAVTDTAFVSGALDTWKERIAIGIDSMDGYARVAGWTAESKIGAVELGKKLEELGAQLVIYTDISRDGLLVGPNIPALERMIRGTNLRVIASGGVAGIDDVRSLAALRLPRLDGVIIGKALYEGRIDLKEALEVRT